MPDPYVLINGKKMLQKRKKRLLEIFFFSFLALGGAIGHAGSTLSPVILNIDARGRAVITVTNDGGEPAQYQLTPLKWSVIDGKDSHEVSSDFIASPPSFTLAAGEKREVRVGFRNAAPSALERTYRLEIDELPSSSPAEGEAISIKLRVKHRVPAYIAPADPKAKPDLRWSAVMSDSGIVVRGENVGQKRFVAGELGLARPGSDETVVYRGAPSQGSTILAQSWREWLIAMPSKDALQPWVLVVKDGRGGGVARYPLSVQRR